MRNASRICFSLIVLSFLAARADAQGDSVVLRFDFSGGGDTYVQTTDYDPANHTAPGPRVEVTVTVTVDVTLKITLQSDSISFSDSSGDKVSFVIDSGTLTFRKLSIAASNGTINGGKGYLSYNAYFDSIPFTRSLQGNLQFQGSVWWETDNNYSGAISGTDTTVNPGAHYVGFFSGSGGGPVPTLDIDIGPTNSSISSVQQASIPQRDLGWQLSIGSMIACFPRSEIPRVLEIYDLMGTTITKIPISVNTESAYLPNSISPGLYFARLGDQVVKFVVPPR